MSRVHPFQPSDWFQFLTRTFPIKETKTESSVQPSCMKSGPLIGQERSSGLNTLPTLFNKLKLKIIESL